MTYKGIVSGMVNLSVSNWVIAHVKDRHSGYCTTIDIPDLTCDDEFGCVFEVRAIIHMMPKGCSVMPVDQEYFIRGYVDDAGRVTITSLTYEYITADSVKSKKSGFVYGPALDYFYLDTMSYSFPEEDEQ